MFVIDDNSEITVLTSMQGSRQGCSAGTDGFCLGLHPVLTNLQQLYPEFEFRVLTDDVIPLVPPPISDAFDDWQALYTRYASCLTHIKDLSFELAGLTLNPGKGSLLLPVGAPLPTAEVRALFPAGFEFRQDGVRIAGSPVGTDAFMREFLKAKLAETATKLTAVKLVGKRSPRAGHRLLTSCTSKLMSFLSSTVPPDLCLPFLQEFDQQVEESFFEILGQSITCSSERFTRAQLKASLPAPHGCGLFKASDEGSVAWWASVSACLQDPLLFKLRAGLARFAGPAWQALVRLHGGLESKYWAQSKHLIPPSFVGLLDGTLYSPFNKPTSIHKHVLSVCKKRKKEVLQSLTCITLLTSDNPSLTESDVIQASSPSYAGKVFSEPIKFFDSLSPASYSNFCRFFLGLPPALTIGGERSHAEFDYPVQRCLAKDHGCSMYLDAHANHASSNCPATYHHRNIKHRNIMRVLVDAAQEAGLATRTEPDTHSLLLGEFSPKECRRVFPKQMSLPYQAAFEKLSQAQDYIASIHCNLSLEQKQIYIQKKIDLLPVHDGDAVGLRIDVCLENTETGETKWVDASVAHPTCASYRVKELKEIAKRRLTAAVTEMHMLPQAWTQEPGPTLLDCEAKKKAKYGRLVMIAARQHLDGKRTSVPVFNPFVVSDFGEFAPAALELQEWLVNQYRRKCVKLGARADGCNLEQLVQQFRHRLKVGVQLAIAGGLGNMIQAAGLPWGGGLGPV